MKCPAWLVLGVWVGGCGGEPSSDAHLETPDASESASSGVATEPAPTAVATETAPSAAVAETAPTAIATETAPPGAQGTCLMWYECGCNVGCSKIAEPRGSLKDGQSVRVVSGVESGKRGFVSASKDATGVSVFSLSDQKPGAPGVCGLPDPRFMGYGCVSSKSGALDAHACDASCR